MPFRTTSQMRPLMLLLVPSIVIITAAVTAADISLNLLGVAPQDVGHYKSGRLFWCEDGSRSFTTDRLNDNFCDCPDGTDEPGTSACPNGRFYCSTKSQTSLWVFSSRVNDGICDCCDGSDEYDGQVQCKPTCLPEVIDRRLPMEKDKVQGGDTSKKIAAKFHKGRLRFSSWSGEETRLKDAVYKLKDLKVLMVLEVVLLVLLIWQFFGRTCRSAAASRRRLPH